MNGGVDVDFRGLRVGFCICGSFCTFDLVIPEIKKLVAQGADVTPIHLLLPILKVDFLNFKYKI